MDTFRKVGLITCTALVLANMIGTGVFTSLGFQVEAAPSPFLILVLWSLGGVIALCGALSYAELAAAFPQSGGEYQFLTHVYHPVLGFMAGFVSIALGFSAPLALAGMAFGKYFSAALPSVPPLAASVAAVLAVAALHSATVKASGNFQVTITSLKLMLILAFIVLGLTSSTGASGGFAPREGDWGRIFQGSFAVALMFVMYSYSGWNAAAYITGEVTNPLRNVPLALLLATGAVTALYLLLNSVFLLSVPLPDYAGKLEVGQMAATALLGSDGGRLMALLISAGLLSAVSAMTWAGPRVAQAVGRDFPALGTLARTSPGGVPRRALVLQTILVLILLITSSFEAILVCLQSALLLCSSLTVLGVIVGRWRQPATPRPFRCPLYPLPPLVYLAVSLFTLVYVVREKPLPFLGGLSVLLVGIGLYFPLARKRLRS